MHKNCAKTKRIHQIVEEITRNSELSHNRNLTKRRNIIEERVCGGGAVVDHNKDKKTKIWILK